MVPFDKLRMPKELACEFLAVFSRFEFALKELGPLYFNNQGMAAPNWGAYRDRAAAHLHVPEGSDLDASIEYLNGEPPQIQIGHREWTDTFDLRGPTPVGTALDAVQRVRNNLFHGGKYTPHSPPGRDEKLVRSALCVLMACLEQDEDLREVYEQPAL